MLQIYHTLYYPLRSMSFAHRTIKIKNRGEKRYLAVALNGNDPLLIYYYFNSLKSSAVFVTIHPSYQHKCREKGCKLIGEKNDIKTVGNLVKNLLKRFKYLANYPGIRDMIMVDKLRERLGIVLFVITHLKGRFVVFSQ